jgi:methylmalonyl-CoA mutase cobalamin-binding domain/chain
MFLIIAMPLDDLAHMIVNLETENIGNAVQRWLDDGTAPEDIMRELMSGMDEVGRLYEQNEFYLPELVLAGETMKEALHVLKPHLRVNEAAEARTIVTATVEGDNHDIGKNILITMLLSAGFDVVDLGADCSPEKIVNAVKEHRPKIVALSALLTMTMKQVARVDVALREAGLRKDVKMIVGGVPFTEEIAHELGADEYGVDAIEGVKRIKALLDE